MDRIVGFLVIFLCFGLSAFFVAAEFAIVRVRSSRIDQLISEGNKQARRVKRILSHLDEYLSACQLGITVVGLVLGWLGEPVVHKTIHPLFHGLPDQIEEVFSLLVSFSLITFLHVVLGELAPKSIALRFAEKWALLFSGPLLVFYRLVYPFTWVLNQSANGVLRLFRIPNAKERDHVHSEEELRFLVNESYKSGEIKLEAYKYVNNIFEFSDRTAHDIKTPRTEMVALDANVTIEEAMRIFCEEQYTRYPLMNGEKDQIIGMVHLKDIVKLYAEEEKRNEPITLCKRDVLHVIESTPINDLLLKMQKERCQISILVDEYGGTAGMVTMEDLIEEIVGEIRDEFDQDEIPMIQEIEGEHRLVSGKYLISDINDLYAINIPEEEQTTIGGWILSQGFENIDAGYEIQYEGISFTVTEANGHHIERIRVQPIFKPKP